MLILLLSFGLLLAGCGGGDDDDDSAAQTDDDCAVCSTTAECTAALGTGWICDGTCCVESGDDTSGTDDDVSDDDDGDDTDDDDSVVPGEIDFNTEDVALVGPGDRQTSMVIDDAGMVHIAYTGCTDAPCARSEATVASNAAKADWTVESIDASGGDTGWFPALTLAADGTLQLIYGNHANYTLHYATKPEGGSWSTQQFGTGQSGFWISSALSGDVLYTAHTYFPDGDMVGNLRAAWNSGSGWSFEVLDTATDAGWSTAMAISSSGYPVVAYIIGYPAGLQKIAEYDGADWTITQIDGDSFGADIAVDSEGYYHLVYPKTDSANSDLWDLWYATNAPSGDWSKLLLDPGADSETDTGGFPSIVVDTYDHLHVTYRNFTQGALMYARKAGGEWEYAIADSIGGGLYSSLAIDADDALHVAYENGSTLRHAVCATCIK